MTDLRDRAQAAVLCQRLGVEAGEGQIALAASVISGARADGWREGLQGAIAALKAEHRLIWGDDGETLSEVREAELLDGGSREAKDLHAAPARE
jgi:hypothetical protein